MTSHPTFLAARQELQQGGLGGAAFCAAYSALIDELLRDLLGEVDDAALVAVGGYGRQEMAPGSDVDVLLMHRGRRDIEDVANSVWYPLWDLGLKVGHGVRTVRDALSLAAGDLETATSLLDTRLVAGDPGLAGELRAKAVAQWRRRAGRWLERLAVAVQDRQAEHGEVAFLLEPDLKEGRGGLRDVHALRWADAARRTLLPRDRRTIDAAYESLLEVRVALHARTGRAADRLVLQEQEQIAGDLGLPDADALLSRVAEAARAIAWVSDESWHRSSSWRRGPIGSRRRGQHLLDGISVLSGRVELSREAVDAEGVLRAAAAAAEHDLRLGRTSLDAMAAAPWQVPDPWPSGMRRDLVALLATGNRAVPVVETLDQAGVLSRILPEWAQVRSKPQRNALHRFTVDRHLCEAAANAAALTHRVQRPDLLLIGAWLHDLGKGFVSGETAERNHSTVGAGLVVDIAARMGFSADDAQVLATMVRHHLLLPDVATRRDLDDPATITLVAEAVADTATLDLLHALTEADSRATGPAAWSEWKARLVADLVARTRAQLEGRGPAPVADVDANHEAVLSRARSDGGFTAEAGGTTLTIVDRDRPGLFARTTGALALHGLDVVSARAWSTDDGWAVETFTIADGPAGPPPWPAVTQDVRLAVSGRISLEARLAERIRAYAFRSNPLAVLGNRPRVTIHDGASDAATVIDVRAPDRIGTLYRITRALADLALDVRSAKVTTMGHEVVDSFYVVDANGAKLEPDHAAEVERAILTELSRL